MPGHLIHTNELLVHFGDQYYGEKSSSQALEVLGARTLPFPILMSATYELHESYV